MICDLGTDLGTVLKKINDPTPACLSLPEGEKLRLWEILNLAFGKLRTVTPWT